MTQLTPCPEYWRLYLLWSDTPPLVTWQEVWDHRQGCAICRENTRILTEQAKQAEMPELEQI